jgi:tRNA nucleotidyltransferase (CCA-adding enzyme)
MLARLDELGLLRAAHPVLGWSPLRRERAVAVPGTPPAEWRLAGPLDRTSIWLTLLLLGAKGGAVSSALARLSVTRETQEAVEKAVAFEPGPSGEPPSATVARLDGWSEAAVVAAWVAHPEARPQLEAYLAGWRFERSDLTGADLVAAGLEPGPQFRTILWRLRAARLDGEVADRAGELRLLRALTQGE